jgi:hypothetical protein
MGPRELCRQRTVEKSKDNVDYAKFFSEKIILRLDEAFCGVSISFGVLLDLLPTW